MQGETVCPMKTSIPPGPSYSGSNIDGNRMMMTVPHLVAARTHILNPVGNGIDIRSKSLSD